MIKQTITYKNYEDPPQEVTEDFYFNLNKIEIMEMELDWEGGLKNYIEKLQKTTAGKEAYYLFKWIIEKSYGIKKSNNRFEKEDDNGHRHWKDFEDSPALSELIFSFISDGNDAAKFVQGLLPPGAVEEAQRELAKQQTEGQNEATPAVEASTSPVAPEPKKDETVKTYDDYTTLELREMSDDEFFALLPSKESDWSREQLLMAMHRRNKK